MPTNAPENRCVGDGSEFVSEDDPRSDEVNAYIAMRNKAHRERVAELRAEQGDNDDATTDDEEEV
jgi:hypothetical protein